MRPVNLIPRDERRGARAPSRSGGLGYLIIAGLAVVLVGLVALALTSNKISDRKAEVASLDQEKKDLQAQAARLSKFAAFKVLQENRSTTIRSLAESRFDWERVMRELAIVLPEDVWLTELTGTVSPNVSLESGADVDTREVVAGPALELIGCAASHDDVARFVAALEDIDGVTRVGLKTTEKSETEDESAAPEASSTDRPAVDEASTSSTDGDCRTKQFITQFKIVAAFDAVPTPAIQTTVPAAAPAPGPPPTTAADSSSTEGTTTTAADTSGATTEVGG